MDAGSNDGELELRHYVGVLWRRKIVVMLTVGVILVVGGAYTYLQTPMYQSSAKVLLQPSAAEAVLNPDTNASRGKDDPGRVPTEIEVMQSPSVKEAVQKALRQSQAPLISITRQGNTDVVAITASSTVPAEAARIAQTYADTYIAIRREQLVANLLGAINQVQAQIDPINQQLAELDRPIGELDAKIAVAVSEDVRRQLQGQRDELMRRTNAQRAFLQDRQQRYAVQFNDLKLASNISTTGAQLVAKAEVSDSPFSPNPIRNLVLTLGLGAFFGAVMAFLRENYDDTIKGKEDLEQVTPALPVLSVIPTVAGWKDRKAAMLVSMTEPSSPPAEAYRALRTSLQFVGLERSMDVVQVTSPNQGESKTTTVCNLAVSLARAGHRVIIVDCNLRKPRLHEFFGLDNAVGLTSALVGDVSLADMVQPVPGESRLAVVASGPLPPDPSELLSSRRCSEILSVLAAEADFVLLDGPPVLPVTDAIVLAGLADAVIMVVAANVTTRDSADRAVELLEQVHAPLIGSVLSP